MLNRFQVALKCYGKFFLSSINLLWKNHFAGFVLDNDGTDWTGAGSIEDSVLVVGINSGEDTRFAGVIEGKGISGHGGAGGGTDAETVINFHGPTVFEGNGTSDLGFVFPL